MAKRKRKSFKGSDLIDVTDVVVQNPDCFSVVTPKPGSEQEGECDYTICIHTDKPGLEEQLARGFRAVCITAGLDVDVSLTSPFVA